MHIFSIPRALTFPRVRLYTQVGGARARSEAAVHRKKSSYYEEEFDVAEAEILAAEQMIAESRMFSTRLFHQAKAMSQRAIVMEAATKDAALQAKDVALQAQGTELMEVKRQLDNALAKARDGRSSGTPPKARRSSTPRAQKAAVTRNDPIATLMV